MEQLSKWFPLIDQMPASLKAFCTIAGATIVVGSVVLFVVLRGRRDSGNGQDSR